MATDLFEQAGVAPKDLLAPPQESLFRRTDNALRAAYGSTPQGLVMSQATKALHGMNTVSNWAGEKTTDLATSAGASPQVAAGLGVAANLGSQLPLAFLGSGAGRAVATPIGQAAGRSLMSSAVKPTIADLRSGDAAKAITTMLEGGFNPTKGGVEAMQKQIANLGDEITARVAGSTELINKNAVAFRLQQVLDKFSKQVNPKADAGAIERAWTEFLSHPLLAGRATMSVPTAQALKQGTYQSLGSKAYGELKGADIEAQKALARGLKEEISKAVPGVADLNAQQAALINAKDIAERRALLEANKNPAGLALLAENKLAGLGFLADRSALVKSLLARLAYKQSGNAGALAGGVATPVLMQQQGALYPNSY